MHSASSEDYRRGMLRNEEIELEKKINSYHKNDANGKMGSFIRVMVLILKMEIDTMTVIGFIVGAVVSL